MTTSFLYDFVKKNHITKPLFIGYFVALALFIYFFSMTIFGERGVLQLIKTKREAAQKAAQKEELLMEIKTKKAMVEGMNSESLDLDLLDEQARKVLGYVGKDEVVMYHENDKNKNAGKKADQTKEAK